MNERRVVDAGDVRLACRMIGDGTAPPLVALHALGEAGSTWEDLASRLRGRYRSYAPDLRGHGMSDRCAGYSFELMRDDVLALLDALNLERVTLLGHSMGAMVAALVAADRPDRVERLVLEEPPPPVPLPARSVPADPDPDAPFDWAMVAAIYRQRNDFDPAYWDLFPAITAPTLIVAGGAASPIPQQEIGRVAARIPDCRLVTVEAGHLVHETRPEEFAAVVGDFL